jgi:hypothetical protein
MTAAAFPAAVAFPPSSYPAPAFGSQFTRSDRLARPIQKPSIG